MPIGIKVELWGEAGSGDAGVGAVFKEVTGPTGIYSILSWVTVESPAIFTFCIFSNCCLLRSLRLNQGP